MDLPKNLDEAIDYLINNHPQEQLNELKKWTSMNEEEAMAYVHFAGGINLRNNLNLWHETDLTKWFNSIGITHADDMSGIIFTSTHRKLNNKRIHLEKQVKNYQNYWKKNGFPDGFQNRKEKK